MNNFRNAVNHLQVEVTLIMKVNLIVKNITMLKEDHCVLHVKNLFWEDVSLLLEKDFTQNISFVLFV